MTGQDTGSDDCKATLSTADYKMNQVCKVCGEPAAGFHFGAFTCEGCKSFFGRSYNNSSSVNDCKNNHQCVINKKNRTACKACRLRKCIMVGMSKSGSRYGRRSNWFKIHCLLQEQQQKQLQEKGEEQNMNPDLVHPQITPPPNNHQQMNFRLMGPNPLIPQAFLNIPRTREELILLGLDDSFKHSVSPSVGSPESHNSDSSVELPDARRLPMMPNLLGPSFLPPPGLLFPPGYHPFYHPALLPTHPASLNNPNIAEAQVKREYLDAVLQMQKSVPTPEENVAEEERNARTPAPTPSMSPEQDSPIDLSMKTLSERGSSPAQSENSGLSERGNGSEEDMESDCDNRNVADIRFVRPAPLDLTTKV